MFFLFFRSLAATAIEGASISSGTVLSLTTDSSCSSVNWSWGKLMYLLHDRLSLADIHSILIVGDLTNVTHGRIQNNLLSAQGSLSLSVLLGGKGTGVILSLNGSRLEVAYTNEMEGSWGLQIATTDITISTLWRPRSRDIQGECTVHLWILFDRRGIR